MSNPIKITRTLFVGLGGTGVKAILRAKQCFVDAYGEVPPMVAFLAIDTDKSIRDESLPSRKGKEVKLKDNEICFCGITGSAIDIFKKAPAHFQWIPKRNINYLKNLKNEGAKQVRSNGRFLARHNAKLISTRVANVVDEISKSLPIGSRFVYDTNREGVEYPIKVNVVGSVAGGTGSGTIIDMLVLIAKTLREKGKNYAITPWIVLPEVFRHMAPGPASLNVYQNAYGAIRELDYLYHLPIDNQNALDFKFDKVYHIDEGIGDTYLVNNTNKAGVVFLNIKDIADSIGRCMFLAANDVSNGGDFIKDNTDTFRDTYSIRDKKSHYQSAGSAEIIYDNQAVRDVIAKGIIAQICNELYKSNSIDALQEVGAWAKSVGIEEHNADQLIDSILSKYAQFAIVIDKEADENTIKAYIFSGAEAPNVIEEAQSNELKKFEKVKLELYKKIKEILNTQNGIGYAKAFLESLSNKIVEWLKEMNDEVADLQKTLAYNPDWVQKIATIKTGVFKIFYKDAAMALQSEIADYIAQKRDLLRHDKAIQFFTDLDAVVKELYQKVIVFKSNVESVEKRQMKDINAIQQQAKTSSKFAIYLHSYDVEHFSLPKVDETSALFRDKTPIYTLIGKTEDDLCDLFFDFAQKQQSVIDAVDVSVEQKMRSMSDKDLKEIFAKVKEMSSPLWGTNPYGYLDEAQELTTIFTIGVYDQSSGFIQEKYMDEFTLGAIQPIFATTHETDRITFFQIQLYSPAYAVNNMVGYMRDADEKLKTEAFPVFYLDEKWNQRMIVEGFDILPKQEKDRVLPNWVNAIVYGFIKYDEAKKTYFIKSKQGNKLVGGFLPLGERRDLAFEQFQLRGLDKEVENRLQKMSIEQGQPAVNAIIQRVKNDTENYVSQYAQLSVIELDRVLAEDPTYQMVGDILIKEITYLEELDV